MVSLLPQIVLDADRTIYQLLSQLHGNWFLDRWMIFQETNVLFKSGIFISLYVYFWFRPEPNQETRRRAILSIMLGTIGALVMSRIISNLLAFRVRPLDDATLGFHPLSVSLPEDFVSWSAFPSDHAAYLGALGFGLICLSSRLTIPIAAYMVGWICLPRLYLGIHYTSDIVAGLAIGVAIVLGALRIRLVHSTLAGSIMTVVRVRPQVFYTIAFLAMYEMAALFWDIRGPVVSLIQSSTVGHHSQFIRKGILVSVIICAIAALTLRLFRPILLFGFVHRQRRTTAAK